MPVIKEYTSQYRASGEFGGRRASAEDFVGSGESSSFLDGLDLKKIGDATQDVAKYLYKEEEQREVTDLHVQMAKANADWSENMVERQKTAKPGDMSFATSVTQDMKGYFEEMGGNYKTKAGQQQFKLQSADMVSRYGIAAIKHQSVLAGEYAKVQHAQLNEDLGRSAFNDPTQYESLRQQAARAIDDPKSNYANLDPASREELKLKTLNNIDLATVKGLATHAPEFLLGNVAPDVMARFKPVATALVKQGVLPKANFNDVLDTVSQAEGGYVNNPGDAGGETNRGISKRAYPNLDIKNLTKAQADKIYKEDYWNKIDGDKLPPATALVAMHVAVMSGVGRANMYLKESGGDPQKMIDMQRDFLTSLAKNPKRNDAQFYNGWMKRMDTLTANVSTMPSVSNLPIEEVVQQQDKTPAKVGIAAFDNLSWKEQYETIHAAEQTIRTNRTFDNNARVEAERAKVEAQNASMNNYLNRILDNDATVARDLRSDKVLTFAQREHVLNTISVRAGKMDNTDSGVFIDTFKGIHDGTITSDTQINALMGRGLSITDVNRLRNELVGKNQPMGEVRKQFYKMAEAQISKSSMIAKDPEGEAQLYKWIQYVESVIAEKTKEGVSMNRLFNPNDKEYLGWTINGFVRGPKQQMSDMASRMKGAPPQPAMGQTVLPRPSLDQIFSGKP